MAKTCPHCGSTIFIKFGTQVNTKDQSVHTRYRCKRPGCMKFFIHPHYTGKKKDTPKQPIEGSVVVLDDDGEISHI